MRKKGRDCYSKCRDRSRDRNWSGGRGGGAVEFDGHSSDGESYSERRILEGRSRDRAFYSH